MSHHIFKKKLLEKVRVHISAHTGYNSGQNASKFELENFSEFYSQKQ